MLALWNRINLILKIEKDVNITDGVSWHCFVRRWSCFYNQAIKEYWQNKWRISHEIMWLSPSKGKPPWFVDSFLSTLAAKVEPVRAAHLNSLSFFVLSAVYHFSVKINSRFPSFNKSWIQRNKYMTRKQCQMQYDTIVLLGWMPIKMVLLIVIFLSDSQLQCINATDYTYTRKKGLNIKYRLFQP